MRDSIEHQIKIVIIVSGPFDVFNGIDLLMETIDQNFWKRCSSCKREIGFQTNYYLCSVSTCRHPRTESRFCSVPCWDAHLGFARHREAWAEEAVSPSKQAFLNEQANTAPVGMRAPMKKVVGEIPSSSLVKAPNVKLSPPQTLVVVSRIKEFIHEQSAFNTSQDCIDALSERIADLCRSAIERAKAAGRKTVMGRDVE